MAQRPTIRSDQIRKAKRIMEDLPEKEEKKTRQEAAELLEASFRKAKSKGYKPKELSQILKNEGIIIPAYLIKRHFTETRDAPKPEKQGKAPVKQPEPATTSFIVPDLPDEEL
ncbi:MAG: hypothetical protein IJD16_00330 [Desulfovibrio sp.]|nr:hypothetical protein [Desulfovibrio sp.]